MPRLPGYLYRAWRRASAFERALVALAAADYAEELASTIDVGVLAGVGRRPGGHASNAPLELVELVWRFGMKLAEVAAEIGVSSRTVQRWWHGECVPRRRWMVRLSVLLGERRLGVGGRDGAWPPRSGES
jgi:hypothetical protein